jgi:hypothetical protein
MHGGVSHAPVVCAHVQHSPSPILLPTRHSSDDAYAVVIPTAAAAVAAHLATPHTPRLRPTATPIAHSPVEHITCGTYHLGHLSCSPVLTVPLLLPAAPPPPSGVLYSIPRLVDLQALPAAYCSSHWGSKLARLSGALQPQLGQLSGSQLVMVLTSFAQLQVSCGAVCWDSSMRGAVGVEIRCSLLVSMLHTCMCCCSVRCWAPTSACSTAGGQWQLL